MPKPIVALAWAAAAVTATVATLVVSGCPSLSALECQGAACADGGAAGGSGDAGSGGPRAIACGGGLSCTPGQQECCVSSQKTATCTALQCSGGSDIFCDDPSQCGGAPCWLCNAGGFQGTSCDYANDIVQSYHCTSPTDVYRLCHATSQCDAGTTCAPLAVAPPGLDAGGGSWFYACQ